MATKQFPTLLDLTATTGTNTAIKVVQIIQTYAPELELFGGRPINGLTYEVTRLRELPGGTAFRAVNQPVLATAGKWEKVLGQCFRIDRPVQIDRALVEAQMAQYGGAAENFEASMVEQQMRALGILLGKQFYTGRTQDALGFDGLTSFVDNSPYTCVDAGGTTAGACSSAWIVYNAPEGIHWTYGNGKGLNSAVWQDQQIQAYVSGTSGALGTIPMRVNNISGWLGLANNAPLTRTNQTDLIACVRIANLKRTIGGVNANGLTDSLIASAKKLFPLSISNNPGSLTLLVNRFDALNLANSRMAAFSSGKSAITVAGPLQYSDEAGSSCGIKIVQTDSIAITDNQVVIA